MPPSDNDNYKVALALGELSARVKSIEDRVQQSDNISHNVIAELRDEIRNNTQKFETIIQSLGKLVQEHREDVSEKIEKATKELSEEAEKKFITKLQFSTIEAQLNGLTTKLTMIWSGIIVGGYLLNWIATHPGILTILGGK